jgi:hypothetical protein
LADLAVAEYRTALAIREAYATRYPTRAIGRFAISISYLRLATGAPDAERLEYLYKALAIREQLLESEPTEVKWQYALAYAHERLAGQFAESQPQQALAHVEKAIALQEAAIAKDWRARLGTWWTYDRDAAADGRILSSLHLDAARLLRRLARPREAVRHCQAALAINVGIYAGPDALAMIQHRLGEALAETGDRAGAVEELRKAADRYHRQIAVGDGSSSTSMRELDRLVRTLGALLLDLGRETEARELFRAVSASSATYASHTEKRRRGAKGGADGPAWPRRWNTWPGTRCTRAILPRRWPRRSAACPWLPGSGRRRPAAPTRLCSSAEPRRRKPPIWPTRANKCRSPRPGSGSSPRASPASGAWASLTP